MKPFNIELAKKGEKVITRCGFKAEFAHDNHNNNDNQFIFTIYDSYNNPIFNNSYLETGREAYSNGGSDYDLFMAEESDFKSNPDIFVYYRGNAYRGKEVIAALEKLVYYRGDEDRGDEIIADLEKRGGKNVNGYSAYHDSSIYFINQFGLIDVAEYDSVKDFLDRCTELHLPPKKVKKEGWINLVNCGLSKRSCIIPSGSIYDSECEAKEAAKRFDSSLKNFKTIKIDWEEEVK